VQKTIKKIALDLRDSILFSQPNHCGQMNKYIRLLRLEKAQRLFLFPQIVFFASQDRHFPATRSFSTTKEETRSRR